jgi:hypothetical protein
MRNVPGVGNLAKRGSRRVLGLLLVVALLTGDGGCTRVFFRKSADREVNDILAEKDQFALWRIEQYHVYTDPRSRFADPTNPDRPPMPPDDDAAWKMSPHPQQPGKAGVANVQGLAYLEIVATWDAENRAELKAAEEAEKQAAEAEEKQTAQANGKYKAQPDGWVSAAPPPAPAGATGPAAPTGPGTPPAAARNGAAEPKTDEAAVKNPVKTYMDEPLRSPQRGYLLTLDQAVELGVINSPLYQTFREELYEVGLVVTQQRYNFAFQWTAIEDFIRKWAGPLVGNENNWTANTNVGFTKMFSTGALLTFDFVNNTVWNLTSPKANTSVSTINLDFVQPLLRGGGRAVTLEPLTQAERNLFYAIRSYARFREQFYVNVAIGSTLPAGLTTVVGGGGSNPISVLAALNIASTDVSGGFVGFLSTLFREVDMAADKKLVADLEQALRIYEGYQEGGLFSPLQVDQVRSTLLNARNTVMTDQQFVNNALDQFKQVLGLPSNLPLILDDSLARPITNQYDRYYRVITDSDAAYSLVEKQENLPPDRLREFLLRLYTRSDLVRGTAFSKTARPIWDSWVKLSEKELRARLERLREERRKLLDLKTELDLKKQTLSPKDERRLRESEIEADFGLLEEILRQYEARPWEKLPTAAQRRQAQIKLFRQVAYSAEAVLVWARNERFQNINNLWPELPTVPLCDIELSTAPQDLAQEVAVKHALTNRWDLMNARAQVVDAWRQVRVTANALLAVFNVHYNLQAVTPPTTTTPFNFSSDRTTQTLTLDTQLPLNRLKERNAYRTALITYQRTRRAQIILEDNIAAQLRFDVRQLQLFANNYRIQKAVVQSLYSQVESAKELITAPTDPAALQSSGTAGQANAAALTSQYLSALSSLNGAQTRMYDIWLSYLATRMQLYLDLESLRMDARGVWLEEPGVPSGKSSSADCAKGSGSSAPVPPGAQATPAPRAAGTRPDQLPPPKPLDQPNR